MGPGTKAVAGARGHPLKPELLIMPKYDNDNLCRLRLELLDHPIYTRVVSVAARPTWPVGPVMRIIVLLHVPA